MSARKIVRYFCVYLSLKVDIVLKTEEIKWIGMRGSKRAALKAPRLL